MNLLLPFLIFIYSLQPAACWGDLGHRTVAYLAQKYFSNEAKQLVDDLLPGNNGQDISDAAVWADKMLRTIHPEAVGFLSRQIVVAEDTNQLSDQNLAKDDQADALKFLIHFLGDIHQPLHVEALEQGGNKIHVCFDHYCSKENLHAIWDTDIPHKMNGIKHNRKHNEEKEPAERWAASLFQANRFRPYYAECSDIQNPLECAMLWAKETNRLNCDYVLKNGIDWVEENDLGGEYYDGAAPIVNEQIYKAGVRLATWINTLAAQRTSSMGYLAAQGGRLGRYF
ncbi:hypothetical protein ANOM_011496 [Aspergillus nomiae NRRL 13137]|uniref:Nuclease S1 n=1 Tax=Aspergillus nomiae NRRL (strain ATCC 15546 / NRRL 13137 / CBS 260.88 / M93) TaxID=1509407 RepID=A0A0L1ILG4_ASPN3|nr:uncharacterized protein ANOM_011496 [Aspergillus nomiae NRRL 13137]KNG80367.1 hypothetical protein ANOM_011496 [Aspergillus nomiae NRRL 13137]